jgi:hypothetical protein
MTEDRSDHFVEARPDLAFTVRPPLPGEALSDEDRVPMWTEEEAAAEIKRLDLEEYEVKEDDDD